MRCHICDRPLSSDEIKHNKKYGKGNFDPCGVCIEVVENVFEPPSDEEDAEAQTAFEFYYAELNEEVPHEENSS